MIITHPTRTFSFVYSGCEPICVFALVLRNSFAGSCIRKKIFGILKLLSAKNEEIALAWLERDFMFYNPRLNQSRVLTMIKIRINRLQVSTKNRLANRRKLK